MNCVIMYPNVYMVDLPANASDRKAHTKSISASAICTLRSDVLWDAIILMDENHIELHRCNREHEVYSFGLVRVQKLFGYIYIHGFVHRLRIMSVVRCKEYAEVMAL